MRKEFSILIQLFFALGIVLVYSFVLNQNNFEIQISTILVLQFFWQSFDHYKRNKTLITVPYLFLLAAFLFNGGEFIVKLFNKNDFQLIASVFNNDIKNYAILFVGLSFSFLYFGVLVTQSSQSTNTKEIDNSEVRTFKSVGLFLLILSVFFQFDYLFSLLKISIESGYYSIYSLESNIGLHAIPKILRDFYIPSLLILYWCDIKLNLRTKRIWVILIFIHAFLLFMIGYRGHAIMPLLGFAFLYDKQYKKINTIRVAFIGVLILFIIFPLIKNFRNVTDTISFNDISQYITESISEISILREMGGSIKTVAHTIELVPSQRNFSYGTGYLWALSSLLPNIFTDGVHPAIENANFAQWLTREINPYAAATGGGMGFSFIAEAYLNFSIFGLIFILLFGSLLSKLEDFTNQRSINVVIIACFLSFFLMYSRGQFLELTRSFVWYSLGPYLIYLLIRKVKQT